MAEPLLSRLCPHLATKGFRSGHRHLDLNLRTYAESFDDGDETAVFVLVGDDSRVVAYVALSDLVLRQREGDLAIRCFAIPAIAVDEDRQGSNYALRLVVKARRVFDLRQEAHLRATGFPRYDGIACMGWTERLERTLERLGFEPIPGDYWWFRPWRADDTDDE
jgi:hypothetical protein